MPTPNWEDTILYKELKQRTGAYAKVVTGFLERPDVMATIETILDKGGNTPKNFTLHDAGHSFRVAERIWELIPDVTKAILSEYELALLLLSAYLHDIGMSPDYETVQRHRTFLVEKKKNAGSKGTILTEEEIDSFQRWIDNDPRVKNLDVRRQLVVTDASLANYILAYYIRDRHNDWSGDWISRNFSGIVWTNYPSWVNDLVKICKSHHQGLKELSDAAFDPKFIGPDRTVHLRYLAICLRVADVMENDPGRTPEVLVAHRRIDAASLVYWQKDSQFTLRKDGDQYSAYARPKRAHLHKAVEDTVGYIENELKRCDELIRTKPLTHAAVARLGAYEWNVKPFIQRDIHPYDNAYVYIQGAFRPHTSRILELLGGSQLYGDSIWAYRELIQNAFDAVKERIAYQILHAELDVQESRSVLGSLYKINLSLEKRKDGIWLICKDQGVGMTREIIEKFFLENGASKRQEIKDLERKCEAKGFHLGRTGQFGIGVLSYFMLAEKVVVRTKRLPDTGYQDAESVAWHFEINGMHDFGELKTEEGFLSGTEISFKLKEEVADNIDQWNRRFTDFLTEQVRRTPCAVAYKSFLTPNPIILQPGWTTGMEHIKNMLVEFARISLDNSSEDRSVPVSAAALEARKRSDEKIDEMAMEMNKVIDFLSDEGEIKGVGRYRISIPYYKLARGNSFFFLREQITGDKHYIHPIFGRQCWLPEFNYIQFDLKGIGIEGERKLLADRFSNVYLEIDFEVIDEKKVEISRHKFNPAGMDALFVILVERISGLIEKNAEKFNNCYGILNQRITQKMPDEYFWGYTDNIGQDQNRTWEAMQFPILGAYPFAVGDKVIAFRGQEIRNVYHFDWYMSRGKNQRWHSYLHAKFELAFSPGYPNPRAICADRQKLKWPYGINLVTTPGGPWKEALMVNLTEIDWLLNEGHPLFNFFDPEGFSAMRADGSWMYNTQTGSKSDCLSYLLCAMITYNYTSAWVGFCEAKPEKMKHIFHALDITEAVVLTDRSKDVYTLSSFQELPLGQKYIVTDPQYLII